MSLKFVSETPLRVDAPKNSRFTAEPSIYYPWQRDLGEVQRRLGDQVTH